MSNKKFCVMLTSLIADIHSVIIQRDRKFLSVTRFLRSASGVSPEITKVLGKIMALQEKWGGFIAVF